MQIDWPKGKSSIKFQQEAALARDAVLSGTMLCIDPSSGGTSIPGYAKFNNGVLLDKGEIQIKSKDPIHKRLRFLNGALRSFGHSDVVVIEYNTPTAHIYLKYALAVTMGALSCDYCLLMPIDYWKRFLRFTGEYKTYQKSNANDAVTIGRTMIRLSEDPCLNKSAVPQKSMKVSTAKNPAAWPCRIKSI